MKVNTTAHEFELGIDRFVKKTKVTVERAIVKVNTTLLEQLQDTSPVDTGRFRDSWRLSVNEIDPTQEPFRGNNKELARSHALTRARVMKARQEMKASLGMDSTTYITNSVHYGPYLESGTSRKAPQGVMRVAIIKTKALLGLILHSVK